MPRVAPLSAPYVSRMAAATAISSARRGSAADTASAASVKIRWASVAEPMFTSIRARRRATSASSRGSVAVALTCASSFPGPGDPTGGPGGARGRQGQRRPLRSRRRQGRRTLVRRQRGGVPTASLGPRPDIGQGVDDLLVGTLGGRGPVPGLTVRIPAAGQRLRERAVGRRLCASVAAW